jgi:aryl-alcohol dehydrogenase-like predicted oxidoreductase
VRNKGKTMRYKLLGRSGLRVSELCLGSMSFGDKWGFGANKEETARIIGIYRQAGGNFLDTANKYHEGQSEEFIGEIIEGDRDRWVLATKYTLNVRPGDVNGAGNSRKSLMTSVHDSLQRLRTSYIDLLWVHAWDFTTPADEVMRGLDDLVSAGKVHYVGISDAPAWVVAHANTMATLRGWTPFVALQIEYSLIQRTVERDLLPMAEYFGLTVTPWAPLGGGVLTGKHTRSAGKGVDTARNNDDRLTRRNLDIARAVDGIADALGKTSAQVAAAWVRQRGTNIIPIVGARRAAQIEDLLGSLDLHLSDEHMAQLNEVSKIRLGFPHEFSERVRPIVFGDLHAQLDLPPLARPRS